MEATITTPLRFGTSGVPRSLEGASTSDGLRELGRLGLQAMELAFVRQINIGESQAPVVRELAGRLGISLSAHAPYYINLNSRDKRIVAASRQRILRAARIGSLCGATHVVFHAAWRHDDLPQGVYQTVRTHLTELSQILAEEGTRIWLSPETMGRRVQFGDLDELLSMAQDVRGIAPCFDFAHLHARYGEANTAGEFEAILSSIATALGEQALADLHIHASGIRYGKRGEVSHLTLDESDFRYRDLLLAMKARGVGGTVICESPANDADALLLAQVWAGL
jgi:deoxyribonuclease IV